MDLKRCPQCGREKPLCCEFFCANKRTKDGYACYCKECHAARYKAFYAKNRGALVAKATERVARLRATDANYLRVDRERSRLRKREALSDPAMYEAHLQRGRNWRRANPEREKQFKHASPEHRAARAASRVARKLRATPAWADASAIAAIYAEARVRTLATGVEHQVDHIAPLRGRTVSGLHVHQNLRVIPKQDNVRKGNRFIPELFGA